MRFWVIRFFSKNRKVHCQLHFISRRFLFTTSPTTYQRSVTLLLSLRVVIIEISGLTIKEIIYSSSCYSSFFVNSNVFPFLVIWAQLFLNFWKPLSICEFSFYKILNSKFKDNSKGVWCLDTLLSFSWNTFRKSKLYLLSNSILLILLQTFFEIVLY